MQVGLYLENHQPIIFKTFVNSLQGNKLSHAYLISGNPGTPLFETAKFLAKSILCDNPNPLACNSCITCMRIDDDNYPDFMVFDGSKQTIKKDDVQQIESIMQKNALEAKGIMVYILHLVENMTPEAVNSLLKFLEEPSSRVYAILTTNNENSVLPTIISRCQSLKLKPLPRKDVINEAVSFGVPANCAELLSYFYNSAELIHELYNDEEKIEDFNKAKEALDLLLEALKESKSAAIYSEQKNVIPLIKTKESARYFLDLLAGIFEDLLSVSYGKEPMNKSYDTILKELVTKLTHLDDSLEEILINRNLINMNLNTSLMLDHILLKITED